MCKKIYTYYNAMKRYSYIVIIPYTQIYLYDLINSHDKIILQFDMLYYCHSYWQPLQHIFLYIVKTIKKCFPESGYDCQSLVHTLKL